MRSQPKQFDPFSACLYCGAPVETFEPGPKGGSSQNMTCRCCLARYNLAIVGPAFRGGEGPLFLEVLEEPRRPEMQLVTADPRNIVPIAEHLAQQAYQSLGIREWPGYLGLFARDQAEGAWPVGDRVVKINSEPDDRFPDGTAGTILGSVAGPLEIGGYLYFVEWDALPNVAVGIAWTRIRRAHD